MFLLVFFLFPLRYVFIEQRIGKLGRVEGPQVIDAFADADPADGHAQFPLDRQDNAALGRAVELGQHDARQGHDIAEQLGLADGVLSRLTAFCPVVASRTSSVS